jgi:hypothetical protein
MPTRQPYRSQTGAKIPRRVNIEAQEELLRGGDGLQLGRCINCSQGSVLIEQHIGYFFSVVARLKVARSYVAMHLTVAVLYKLAFIAAGRFLAFIAADRFYEHRPAESTCAPCPRAFHDVITQQQACTSNEDMRGVESILALLPRA